MVPCGFLLQSLRPSKITTICHVLSFSLFLDAVFLDGVLVRSSFYRDSGAAESFSVAVASRESASL